MREVALSACQLPEILR